MTKQVKDDKGLTAQQEKFAVEVAKGLSQAQAYRMAYPNASSWQAKSVHEAASALMANIKVQSRVRELQQAAIESAEIDVSIVAREAMRLVVSDIAGIVDEETGKIRLPHELDARTRAAVASFEVDEYGRVKYKFWDKNAAINTVAKMAGMFEKDNRQKNPMADFIASLGGNVLGVTR